MFSFRFLVLAVMSLLLSVPAVESATKFTLPKELEIVCSDTLDNVCTAPTACNKNGQASFNAGSNLYPGTVTQRNGQWTIPGGYTISFDSDCEVVCQGDCVCDDCEKSKVPDFVSAGTKTSAWMALVMGALSIMMMIL